MKNVNVDRNYPNKSDAYSTVTVLFLANIMSFIDRQIPAMLVGPIKEDFNITDSQVALLIGFSFAADRKSVV